MTDARRELTRDDLTPLARAAVGRTRRLAGVSRLRGGTKKGVYRLAFDDDTTAVAYVWSPDEDYWSSGPVDDRDPFSHASGIDLFTASYDRLTAVGIRTPRLLFADRTHAHLPADAAVVEDIRGGSLEELLHRDPEAAAAPLRELSEALRTMHAHRAPRFGKVALVDNGGVPQGSSCEQVVRDRALSDLAEAAGREDRIAAVREALHDLLHTLAAAVGPRTHHTLIHGELGPDHVLVDANGHPALIDIEGLLYFDAEWEHVFLRQRFQEHYEALRVDGLDADRLRLYRLAMHLSLVAGPLRLLDVGDFPDPASMRGIAEHSLEQTLTLLRTAS
ncbi:phosphotransferase family protein [Streptomyces sp. NBC_00878]|uniref:phosphotransferase family protein n=1 Tax=Streptomyces sp. NBC_00878 TaxID=2975854 RepID=UPI0022568249|nr:phosphotransferase [Streptomyces sp. NBC_00878]MCX4905702.1 aminoglycoside phosphotransferase family protein [Streptomyces sp. NBC_00878]